MPRIEDEIKQKKFSSERQKASVNLMFTSAWLSQHTLLILRPAGLSVQQFNILRILRGQGSSGANLKTIQERMIDRMSNVSRLIEKLQKKGLISAVRRSDDKRTLDIRISAKGSKALSELDRSMTLLEELLKTLSGKEISKLNHLLDKMRG